LVVAVAEAFGLDDIFQLVEKQVGQIVGLHNRQKATSGVQQAEWTIARWLFVQAVSAGQQIAKQQEEIVA
jgi:hypothetical protein